MAESKVSLIYTEEKGRCWIANEDISQEDILLVSKPYAIIPSIKKKNNVCANCMYISNKMIPCRQGCLHAFYCSNECEQQQWNKFHQYECSFLEKICMTLKNDDYNDYVINYARLVMRMLTQRLNDI